MPKLEIPIGTKFGRLTTVGNTYIGKNRKSWVDCECSCDKKIVPKPTASLIHMGIKSCGCISVDNKFLHGQTKSRLFIIWTDMKMRCGNCNDPCYHRYGGRGIQICQDWQYTFINFRDWALSNGYKENLQIDRIDNMSNYNPNNCRWVTLKQNSRNRRNNRFLTIFNETKTIIEWSEDNRCMVEPGTFKSRIQQGWSAEKALITEKIVGNPKNA